MATTQISSMGIVSFLHECEQAIVGFFQTFLIFIEILNAHFRLLQSV